MPWWLWTLFGLTLLLLEVQTFNSFYLLFFGVGALLVGLLDAASNNPMAKSELERACMRNDRFACAMAKQLK